MRLFTMCPDSDLSLKYKQIKRCIKATKNCDKIKQIVPICQQTRVIDALDIRVVIDIKLTYDIK